MIGPYRKHELALGLRKSAFCFRAHVNSNRRRLALVRSLSSPRRHCRITTLLWQGLHLWATLPFLPPGMPVSCGDKQRESADAERQDASKSKAKAK